MKKKTSFNKPNIHHLRIPKHPKIILLVETERNQFNRFGNLQITELRPHQHPHQSRINA